jgi:hypothetical protein
LSWAWSGGGGSLRLPDRGKQAYLAIHQSAKQSDFVDHLFQAVEVWTWYAAPKRQESINKDYPSQVYTHAYFRTFSHPVFTQIHGLFYRQVEGRWVKVIPEAVETWLTPTVFAYHVMSDGSFYYKNLTLHVNNFTKEDGARYAAALNDRFDLHGYMAARGPYWVIFFPAKDLPRLQALLAPSLLPSFRYKVGL